MRQRQYSNRHQYAFLRKLRNHPHGLPTEEWPATSTLKRWLKRKSFRSALKGIMSTFRLESELMSAGAAARAAQVMQQMLSGFENQCVGMDALRVYHEPLVTLSRIIRMDHIRQREKRMLKIAHMRTPEYKAQFMARQEEASYPYLYQTAPTVAAAIGDRHADTEEQNESPQPVQVVREALIADPVLQLQ